MLRPRPEGANGCLILEQPLITGFMNPRAIDLGVAGGQARTVAFPRVANAAHAIFILLATDDPALAYKRLLGRWISRDCREDTGRTLAGSTCRQGQNHPHKNHHQSKSSHNAVGGFGVLDGPSCDFKMGGGLFHITALV